MGTEFLYMAGRREERECSPELEHAAHHQEDHKLPRATYPTPAAPNPDTHQPLGATCPPHQTAAHIWVACMAAPPPQDQDVSEGGAAGMGITVLARYQRRAEEGKRRLEEGGRGGSGGYTDTPAHYHRLERSHAGLDSHVKGSRRRAGIIKRNIYLPDEVINGPTRPGFQTRGRSCASILVLLLVATPALEHSHQELILTPFAVPVTTHRATPSTVVLNQDQHGLIRSSSLPQRPRPQQHPGGVSLDQDNDIYQRGFTGRPGRLFPLGGRGSRPTQTTSPPLPSCWCRRVRPP
ncbi:hypothetical protein E2C01_025235 [Portunus trituberculatus]|uniref:Uncharacterized protein n=1 Tax=Portunus trituberculatus TaxID=210409 RepID=A0A5B7EHB5_PORTR|nr:hypothetical protein [Portunus trituberculatus]